MHAAARNAYHNTICVTTELGERAGPQDKHSNQRKVRGSFEASMCRSGHRRKV